jgi:hypothetical protein
MPSQRIEVVVGMRVRLRKAHPCGSDTWSVTRVGADIGLNCTGCGRRILVERETFERRVKQIIETPVTTPSTMEETT